MFPGLCRVCVFAVGLLAMASCKNVVERPLVGPGLSSDAPAVSGEWISIDADEEITVEIKAQETSDWYDFSFLENDRRIEGEFRAGYLGDKLILNVNLASLLSGGTLAFKLSEPGFLLMGAHLEDGKLVIVASDMAVFEERFADYFEGEPRRLTDHCAVFEGTETTDDGPCSVLLATSKVIAVTETAAFHRALLESYNDVFPMEEFLVLKPKN